MNSAWEAQGKRRNGLLHGFTFEAEEGGLDGLGGCMGKAGDVGDCVVRGEVGGLPGGIGAFLGDSYDVLT